MKNEALKVSTYSEFQKQTTKTQHRLLYVFDAEKGQFQMAFMEPLVLTPRSAGDYKASIFSIYTNKIHEIVQINLHKQTRELIILSLTSLAMIVSKLQLSLNNMNYQLKIENMSSFAKDNRIKSLEDLVINIGHDPKDVKAV